MAGTASDPDARDTTSGAPCVCTRWWPCTGWGTRSRGAAPPEKREHSGEPSSKRQEHKRNRPSKEHTAMRGAPHESIFIFVATGGAGEGPGAR